MGRPAGVTEEGRVMAGPNVIDRQLMGARNGLVYLTGASHPVMGQTPRELVWKRDGACLWRYRFPDGVQPRSGSRC
jgi:hypothetical protein